MPQTERTSELIERARHVRMTPEERRAQRRSLIRGLSDRPISDAEICEVLPGLTD